MTRQDVHYEFDHHTTEFAEDPWRIYRKLRETCPVAHSAAYEDGFWVLTSYSDVRRCTVDTETFSSDGGDLLIPSENPGRLLPVQADPPMATAYRRLINPLFTVSAVRAMEPAIRRYVDDTIDEFIERGTADLVTDLALPVPGLVTMNLVGWPERDWPEVVEPIRDFSTHRVGEPERAAAGQRLAALRRRVSEDIRRRRQAPGDDLVTRLLAATVDGRPLDEDEIVDITMMVLFGGVDTTVAAIGNMALYLDSDRDLRARLSAHPELVPAAVDELLRYEAPVQGFARFVRADTEIGGERIRRGEKVLLAWASANRDPEAFPDPDTVRLDRSPNPHLSFGIGPHRCIGATLAKAELAIVLRRLLERMPDYTVDRARVRPTVSCGTTFARATVPVRFTPGSRLRAKGGDQA
ncbi:cytochrome P450 [Amycolatopsis taiwanensis]|uniref:cytochrome P450 n=1 Tax=Amycolatopsis taiwanensis TaxID=342230 RepID=UPI000486E390|nr:cytochrome P450 [Amycolatopsis taiwanensis]